MAPSQTIFLFPESYNRLRKELRDHWPELWKKVQWYMAFDADQFIEKMNAELDLRIWSQKPTIADICTRYLDELIKRRGAIEVS